MTKEAIMTRRQHITCSQLAAILLGGLVASGNLCAQTIADLAGTWSPVSNVNESGGTRTDTYGPNPKGILMVDSKGHYVLALARAGLPKVASNNRVTATAEENKAIVGGSIFHTGTILVNASSKTLTFKIETSTFPNWDGTEQTRSFTIAGDELTYVAPGSSGGTVTAVWRRKN
jgi:Lipocalin-like domain